MNSTLNISAKSLVLDLLRMVHPHALPVGVLVRSGEMFGISGNAIRVNVTRLLAKNQIEQDERGRYRFGRESLPHNQWLSQWQLGEERVKDWKQDWLILHCSSMMKAKERKVIFKMAAYFGFRELMPGTWIRPNNLNRDLQGLSQQIASLAQLNDFVIFESKEIALPGHPMDVQKLWAIGDLERDYQELIEIMEEGISKVDEYGLREAFRRSYLVGVRVHQFFAQDPLLPSEFLNVELREKVVKRFFEYDEQYRSAWNQLFRSYRNKASKESLTASFTQAKELSAG